MVNVDGRHQGDALYTQHAKMLKELLKKYAKHGIVNALQMVYNVFNKPNVQIIKLKLHVQI